MHASWGFCSIFYQRIFLYKVEYNARDIADFTGERIIFIGAFICG